MDNQITVTTETCAEGSPMIHICRHEMWGRMLLAASFGLIASAVIGFVVGYIRGALQ